MNRDEFRQHMNNYKKARESNPSLSYWQWKANKYADGTDEITNTTLPEVVVTPKRNYVNYPIDQDAYNSAMLDAWSKQTRIGPEDVIDYVPVIGDIKGVYDIAKDFANKEYLAGATGLVLAALPNVIEKPLRRFGNKVKNTIFGLLLNNNLDSNNLNTVQNLARNREWSNFISTINGDNYYRLQNKPGFVSDNVRQDNGGYFISHTTPWEEFTGLGNSSPIGSQVLYEFPTQTFGKLNSSDSNGFIGNKDVTELGRQHLLYGNTASSERIPVRLVDDNTASLLDMDSYTIGIKDRPLTKQGFYDTNPDYEQLSQGNQTTVKPEILNNALKNTNYTIYKNTPNGIQKELYIGYEDGTDGIVDELKANTRTTLTPEEQRYLLDRSRQRQRMSGTITPVFDIQDAADLTPIGDVLTARDAYNAVQDRDYIKASAMLGLMLAPPALGRIAKEKIPSFVTAAADKINELRRRERRNKELDTKIFSQGIEDRNRIIEELYDTPGIWDRAYNADITYGTNYVDTYNDLINNYYSNYFNLPEPVRKNIGDAQAMMSAKPEAIARFNNEGIPASWSDFEYYVNPSIENLDKALTRHEMGHYVDFNMSKSNNADKGNLMFNELKKDLSVDPNPLMPNKTDYFRYGTEQKSYMNTLRQFMFDNNMINKIDDQVTQKQIKAAIDKLPSELKGVKAAYKQFKSPRKYTKWFNTIPLLGTIPFIYNYSQEKDSN